MLVLTVHPSRTPAMGGGLSSEGPPPAWGAALARETPEQLAPWLPTHALAKSRDLHLLTMATGVLLSLLTGKTELVRLSEGSMALARRHASPSLRPTLPSAGTMSTMRLGRTLPSLPWPPLSTAFCRGPTMKPTL